MAIRNLKNKAAGTDGIHSELIIYVFLLQCHHMSLMDLVVSLLVVSEV
jgi:hypothetical protein